jgi:hypothetical protein
MKIRFLLNFVLFSLAASGSETPIYSFPVMGDFHYDRMELHDKKFLEEKYPRDMSQILNYVKASEQYAPRLMEAISQRITPETPFVIQLGDFTEGLCGSQELQEAMFRGAIAQVKSKIAVPFLVTKGNHDVTGPGSQEAYAKVMLPFLSSELSRPVERADFVVKNDRDAFVFFDSMVADLEWLEQALADNRDARYLFVATHYPIVPFEYRADWCLLAKPGKEARRSRLIDMLKKANAIVLCGHLHQASYIDYRDQDGGFVQLAHNSVMRSEQPKFNNVLDGASFYTPALAESPRSTPEQQGVRRQLFAAAAPFVKDFFRADGEGYILIKVYAEKIMAEFYNGSRGEPDKVIQIR